MSRVRVHNFAVSLDGFSTGEGQSIEQPFGHAGSRLLEPILGTRTFREMHGESGGTVGADETFANNWGRYIGAEIMGRNKFGPQGRPWGDEEWKGWWGGQSCLSHTGLRVDTPSQADPPDGRMTFHFIEATPSEALRIAKDAAGELDVRIGGGPSTVRAFLAADLIDQMHVVITRNSAGK